MDNQTQDRRAVPVEVTALCKSYAGQVVLKNVSFSVEPGEIFVIMGPSGAGKSVLLRHIAGLDRAEQGSVLVDGLDASSTSNSRKNRSALVFQAGALFNSLSVYDNLAFYPREHRLFNAQTVKKKVTEVLESLKLSGVEDKMPSELSGGMKKRVSIARALVMEPQLLMYDEPTSELDPVASANITRIIGSLKKQYDVTSIVVSHDRDLALSIADRVAFLMDGEIVTIETPEQLKQSKNKRITEFLHPMAVG